MKARRTARGVWRNGVFHRCGWSVRCGTVPQCIGRIVNGVRGCTCPRWTEAQATITRERRLTVEDPHELDRAVGYRVERGAR